MNSQTQIKMTRINRKPYSPLSSSRLRWQKVLFCVEAHKLERRLKAFGALG